MNYINALHPLHQKTPTPWSSEQEPENKYNLRKGKQNEHNKDSH